MQNSNSTTTRRDFLIREAGLAAAAIGVSVVSQARLQRACHGPRLRMRHAWIAATLPLLAAGVALSARVWRRVDWRGRRYDLDTGARLGSGGSAVADA